MRCLIPVSWLPPDMMVFITRMPESAEVTRKVMIRTTHMMVRPVRSPPEIIWPSVANSWFVCDAPEIAPCATPLSSRSIAVPPRMVIHAKQTMAGAKTQPTMNSRTERPLEMRARNRPTNGENAIHQAQ